MIARRQCICPSFNYFCELLLTPHQNTVHLLETILDQQQSQSAISFFAQPRSCLPAIARALTQRHRAHEETVPCTHFTLPADTALPDYRIGDSLADDARLVWLTEESVEAINSNWPHRSATSEAVIRAIVRSNPCMGVQRGGQLVCWIVTYHYGQCMHEL